MKVSGSRVGLLQMLVDADGPLRSADLAATGWAPHNAATGEENIRRHMAMLRKEITASIPGVDFDPIQADGQGYALKLR
ncbi:MAG: hypothetical protein JWO38_5399 [Gemmataceae bacterium]|nr:hypothetical protein [Gemmataceae bacterium]